MSPILLSARRPLLTLCHRRLVHRYVTRCPVPRLICGLSPSSSRHPDAPVEDMENPYVKEKVQCILCKYKVELDYKNTRLLSQFVSTFTGRVYEKHITGLCERQQHRLKEELLKAHTCHYIPVIHKNVKFMKDPELFDPFRPTRPHPH